MKRRVLVAEDDANIREALVATLTSEGYAVETAATGAAALARYRQGAFDLIILDVMMPEKSGYDVCRTVRAKDGTIPIIMLTAKGEEIDKVVGLQLGADDYVTKPFGVRELLARIDAVLRRADPRRGATTGHEPRNTMPARFTFGATDVDSVAYKARRGRITHDLTARELNLLWYFKQRPNQVLSRDELLDRVWGITYGGTTRTLDQHVAQLRKKIEGRDEHGQVIQTVHSVGYRYSGPS